MQPSFAPITAHGGRDYPTGYSLMNNGLLNKGTAYTDAERDALGLRGLLPARIFPIEQQVKRALGNLRAKNSDLNKYIFLNALQNRNETLYYRVVLDHLEEMMPIVYTPTVGQACLEYGAIFRRPRGLWITMKDRGRVAEVLANWPIQDVRLIVVTDGERILGLGDLGALGMGIPIGKLALYTACAGVNPYYCLPITLDVGTDNPSLLDDEMYIGIDQRRTRGEEYREFIEEFVQAVEARYPRCLLQFEDFGNHNAFDLLARYRDRVCSFNDDIQGTASVALAGLLSASRLQGMRLADQKLLFFGAGEAATGIGELFVAALRDEGLSEAEARAKCWFFDSKGLIVMSRDKLPANKRAFAQNVEPTDDFLAAVKQLRPSALIGAAGVAAVFTQEVVEAMAQSHSRPIIFALSNPTSKAECTAEQAYTWSKGTAIFASGSPFPAFEYEGRTLVSGQGNNVYIFPGVGMGVLASASSVVTDSMFLAAARELAAMVTEEELAVGRVFPTLTNIRAVSLRIATAVARIAHDSGYARVPRPADIEADIKQRMFEPEYPSYV
ncbi:MAG: NAD-dependent malic enzyme [Verrucomicrobia bacterium]|nr:MAG: NAD-dependent malic enzyme [Verrucomicrobiota bacterium]